MQLTGLHPQDTGLAAEAQDERGRLGQAVEGHAERDGAVIDRLLQTMRGGARLVERAGERHQEALRGVEPLVNHAAAAYPLG